jgi:hypothetical protein
MMDTEQLEKQLSVWDRLMYIALGSAVTLLAASFDQFLGVAWLIVQVVVTSSGFFILWGKHWRALQLSKERVKASFGYLVASWLLSLVPGVLGADFLYYILVFAYAIFLLVIYRRTRRELAVSDEMFP